MSQRVDFPNMVITQLTESTEDPPTRCSNQMFTNTKLWLMQSYFCMDWQWKCIKVALIREVCTINAEQAWSVSSGDVIHECN